MLEITIVVATISIIATVGIVGCFLGKLINKRADAIEGCTVIDEALEMDREHLDATVSNVILSKEVRDYLQKPNRVRAFNKND